MELAGADVEEILKVKAAFSLALESLLAESGLESRALAGEAGPLEFRVYAWGSGGPSRFYGPVHAAYGFRISAVRLQEAAFCGIASVFDTL